MREPQFIGLIQATFPVAGNHALSLDIAQAVVHAVNPDVHFGWFKHDGVTYYIVADWVHHCINYNCDPATCWLDYELTSDADTE